MEKKCLICETILRAEVGLREFGTAIGIVYDAMIWRTHGNFGSSKFDPMPIIGQEEFLETYICDSCYEKKSSLIYHVKVKMKRNETVEVHNCEKSNSVFISP